jgi:hypothetical protein
MLLYLVMVVCVCYAMVVWLCSVLVLAVYLVVAWCRPGVGCMAVYCVLSYI